MRPVMLFQAQPQDHKTGKDTLHAEVLKKELITNHDIAEEEMAIATGTRIFPPEAATCFRVSMHKVGNMETP